MAKKTRKKTSQKTYESRPGKPGDLLKRSYYMRECIAAAFKQFNRGDVLLPTNSAELLWMALKELPEVRDRAMDLVCEIDVKGLKTDAEKDAQVFKAAAQLKDCLDDAIWKSKVNAYLNTLNSKERYDLVLEAEQKASRTKKTKKSLRQK